MVLPDEGSLSAANLKAPIPTGAGNIARIVRYRTGPVACSEVARTALLGDMLLQVSELNPRDDILN